MTELINPFELPPTPQEIAVWDRFVAEYVRDYDALQACIRMGFQYAFAVEFSRVYMTKPYVLKAIADHKQNSSSIKLEDDRALIMATLREACHHGPYQTRVAAAKTLGGMHGIDQAPDRSGEQLEKLVGAFSNLAKSLPD